MKKSWYVLTLVAVMALSLMACGKKGGASTKVAATTPAPVEKIEALAVNTAEKANGSDNVVADEVAIALGYDLSDLEPWTSATAGRNTVLPVLYEYMAYYDANEECGMSGILMKSYEKVDAVTSRVTIYDNIYDSVGNHMTADDVAYCFDVWKKNGKSVKCKLLESCTVVDTYTVDIKLTKDTVGDVENMLCGLVPIVTKAGMEKSGDGMIENVISTAPYKVSEFVSGSHLMLTKRDDYWQKDESKIQQISKANAKKITYKIITEGFQVPISLETNNIDITAQMSMKDAARFMEGGESSKGYKVVGIKDTNFYWITFNCASNGLFGNNLKLRQAVCTAIDKNGLVQGVLSGGGEVVHAYGNSICVDYNKDWDTEPYYDYDIAKAKALLAESGFDTSKSIRFMVPSATIAKNTAQLIQSYLLQIGLKAEIVAYDSALFQQYKTDPSQWDIMLDSKMSVDYVTSLASTLEASGKALPLNFVVDDKLQSMVTNIVTTSGHTKENINEYMEYVKDQAYIFSLFVPYQYYAMENTVTGVFTSFKSYLFPNACTYSSEFKR